MKDITRRLARHPSAYGPERGPAERLRRILLIGLSAWLLWAGLLSDHSLLRLWQVSHQNTRVEHEARTVQTEAERIDRQLRDPDQRQALAEQVLREEHGLARKDERVYRVDGSAPDTATR
ncbi:MAG: septum formation initiator family protein [Candidatus Eisenbacteria bacterium]